MRKKLAAGNWKMNGTGASLQDLADLASEHAASTAEILICPPATLIHRATETTRNSALTIGAQDCHAESGGAHTGDISTAMLVDAGAKYVITGHSERRVDHGERDATVRAKSRAAQSAGLTAIICMGESLAAHAAANTLEIIAGQLSGSVPDAATGQNTVIAYEPIWAIGTGKIPTTGQIREVHDFIRAGLERRFGATIGGAIRLLYGGSVKPGNAAEIFSVNNVDGALVGGASLRVADFSPIITALENSP
jgi:triosephosphate isomerase (TIM)